jgi:hypothetical protein
MTALFVEGGIFLPKPYNGQRLVAAGQRKGETAEKHPH